MPARKVCQTFFRNALASSHQYRQNAIIDSAAALVGGASLSLTSIGRHLPGPARVKDKIKRVDRLLGNTRLHNDIPLIFKNITSMMTNKLSWYVIAVDWSGYPFQEYHVLRASLLCDGRDIPLIIQVFPSKNKITRRLKSLFWMRFPRPFLPGLVLLLLLMPVFVIGTGSVVVKPIENKGIYAGNPARLIRTLWGSTPEPPKFPACDF